MAGRTREHDGDWDAALVELRGVCLAMPGVTETLSYGNPAFKMGKTAFAVLDIYRGATCVWLLCGSPAREALLAREGFFEAPYDKAKAAVCGSVAGLDWADFAPVVRGAYERLL